MGDTIDFTIRHLKDDDFVRVQEVFEDRDFLLGTMRLPYSSIEAVRERLSPRVGVIRLVAEAAGELAGILEIETFPSTPRHNHVGAIHLIATHPEHRGKGAGRALMEAAIEMAENWLRLTRLELTVWVTNQTAISLYESFGFEVEGTLRGYVFRDGEYVDGYLMARLNR